MPVTVTYRQTQPSRPSIIIIRRTVKGPRRPLKDNFWGGLITTLRREQRISQRQLSMRCKIQSRTLKKLEEGRAIPYINVIEDILNALGYELEALSRASIDERYRRERRLTFSRVH